MENILSALNTVNDYDRHMIKNMARICVAAVQFKNSYIYKKKTPLASFFLHTNMLKKKKKACI